MSTKIITEIVESLKENFDENALQIIERTLYKALKDKEIIDVVKTQPQSNEEALVSFLAGKENRRLFKSFHCILSNNITENVCSYN